MVKKNILFCVKVMFIFSLLQLNNCATKSGMNNVNTAIQDTYDPWEDFNRGTHSFNLTFDKYLLSPLAKGYRFLFPSEIRTGVRNFLSNLGEPWTSINSVLQGNFSNTGVSLARFLINSTVGILGIFDVAKEIGLEKQREDFGQTLAVYGFETGPYLVLPFLGPSTVRDAMGKVVGFLGDPVTLALERNDKDEWIWIGAAMKGIDFREQNFEKLDNLKATSVDFYATLRSLYLEKRNQMIINEKFNEGDPFQEFDIE